MQVREDRQRDSDNKFFGDDTGDGADVGDFGGAVMTYRLRTGELVTSKSGTWPTQYTNRTQAQRAADKIDGAEVIVRGRPFYVRVPELDQCPGCGVTARLSDEAEYGVTFHTAICDGCRAETLKDCQMDSFDREYERARCNAATVQCGPSSQSAQPVVALAHLDSESLAFCVGVEEGQPLMALVNYWVIGTNRETLVVVYERKFVLEKDARLHRADLAARFPSDVYHVQREEGYLTNPKPVCDNQ